MTRINVIPVEHLCDQHLLAEHREILRVGELARAAGYKNQGVPFYTMGTGHVKFFYDKMLFIYERYGQLYSESRKRGFNVAYYSFITDEDTTNPNVKWWNPSSDDMRVNTMRLCDRIADMVHPPRFHGSPVNRVELIERYSKLWVSNAV